MKKKAQSEFGPYEKWNVDGTIDLYPAPRTPKEIRAAKRHAARESKKLGIPLGINPATGEIEVQMIACRRPPLMP